MTLRSTLASRTASSWRRWSSRKRAWRTSGNVNASSRARSTAKGFRSMTEDNGRRNAAEELRRAEVCLSEARALQASKFPYGAVSRAYYGVFHAARALLFLLGIEARSHKAIVSLIGEHYV